MKNYAKKASVSFVLLVGLTLISAMLGHLTDDFQSGWLWLVLLTVAFKGQQITDIFMELKTAPPLWRRLLLAYVIVLPGIIGLIYWL